MSIFGALLNCHSCDNRRGSPRQCAPRWTHTTQRCGDDDNAVPCRQEPNQPCSLEKLRELGVLYWKLDADAHETDPRLAAIRKVHSYSYMVSRAPQCKPRAWEACRRLALAACSSAGQPLHDPPHTCAHRCTAA